MANGTMTTLPATGTTPATGGLNYADYRQKIQQAAARTRQVTGGVGQAGGYEQVIAPKLYKTLQKLGDTQGGIGQAADETGQALIKAWESQQPDLQKKAERAAQGLEMVGESTLRGMQNIENIQGQVRATVQSATDTWGAAAEKADDYVKAARDRVGEVLSKLDEIQTSIGKDRDFAKAHAMQASVQAALGSMKTEERNIMETYGTDSKEYQQFRQSKMNTLASVQSNIHASYQQLAEAQHQTYLNATSDVYTKQNMYLGFQEQQHVEMLKFQAQARNEYAMQEAQFQISAEQLKMAGMENLANWIIETPTFSMDATPLIAMISDIATSSANQYTAWKASKGGKADFGSLLAQAGLTAAGTALGGPIGGAIGGAAGSALAGGGKAAGSLFAGRSGSSRPSEAGRSYANP